MSARLGGWAGAQGSVLGEVDELGLDVVDTCGDSGRVEGGVFSFEPGPGGVVEDAGVEEPLVWGARLAGDPFLAAG